MKRRITILVVLCIVLLSGCGGDYTYTAPTPKPGIKVTVKVDYDYTIGLVKDPICDVYIDNQKVYLAQASDSVITINTELKEGKHDIRIKTEDWGLTSGSQSNEIEFSVSPQNNKFNFTYEHTVLNGLKLWNNSTTN